MDGDSDIELRFALAARLAENGDYIQAAQVYEAIAKLAKEESRRTEALLGLGLARLHGGLAERALEPLDGYLSVFPGHEQARLAKAAALGQIGRHAESVLHYRRVLAMNAGSEEALAGLVSLFAQLKDFESVERYAAMLLELQPRSLVGLEGMADVAFWREDRDAAIAYARKLTTADPRESRYWYYLGMAYHGQDRTRAVEAYRLALELDPGSVKTYINLGALLYESGDLDNAKKVYEDALAIADDNSSLLWSLAVVLEGQGQLDRAMDLYKQIPPHAAESCDARFQIGRLNLQRKDYGAAAELFDSCTKEKPAWMEAWFDCGAACALLGDMQRAKAMFQEALRLQPKAKDTIRCLAELALRTEDHDEAYGLFQDLIDLGETGPDVFYNTALLCQKKGLIQDAAFFYEQAVATKAEFAEALANLGQVYLMLGREREAGDCFRRVMASRPELVAQYFDVAALA